MVSISFLSAGDAECAVFTAQLSGHITADKPGNTPDYGLFLLDVSEDSTTGIAHATLSSDILNYDTIFYASYCACGIDYRYSFDNFPVIVFDFYTMERNPVDGTYYPALGLTLDLNNHYPNRISKSVYKASGLFAGSYTAGVVGTEVYNGGLNPDYIFYRLVPTHAQFTGTLDFGVGPVPLPSSAPLFGAALLLLGGLGSALRKREQQSS